MLSLVSKVLKRLLALVIALPIALYLILLVINVSDEDKSAQVLEFEGFLEQRKQLTAKDNAYISFIGITAKPGEDIHLVGLERIEQLRSHLTITGKPPFTDYFNINDVNSQVRSIYSVCEQAVALNDECQQSLLNQQEKILSLIEDNKLLLQRYRLITQLKHWHEILPASITYDSGMRYQFLMSLQKLNMLSIWQMSLNQNSDEIGTLLIQEGRFVRNILSSTHILITKMIATSAVELHFHWLDFILTNMAESSAKQALVNSIANPLSIPLTAQALSLKQVSIGEWQFTQSTFIQMTEETESDYAWSNFFLLPLFQQQATLNLYGKLMTEAATKLSKDLSKASGNQHCLTEKNWQTLSWYSYNPIGKLLVCASVIDFSDYQEKLNANESLRKSVLTKLTR